MPIARTADALFANARARYDALLARERSVVDQLAELEARREALLATRAKLAASIEQMENALAALGDPVPADTSEQPDDTGINLLPLPDLDDEPADDAGDHGDGGEHPPHVFRRFYKKARQEAALRTLANDPGCPYSVLVVEVYGHDTPPNRKRLRALMWQMKADGLIRPVPGADEQSGRYEIAPRAPKAAVQNGGTAA